jgi:hypothetical protein
MELLKAFKEIMEIQIGFLAISMKCMQGNIKPNQGKADANRESMRARF